MLEDYTPSEEIVLLDEGIIDTLVLEEQFRIKIKDCCAMIRNTDLMDRLAKVLHPEQTNLEDRPMKKSAAAALRRGTNGFAEELDRRVAQRTAELTGGQRTIKKELRRT